jgi:hypothetical protein
MKKKRRKTRKRAKPNLAQQPNPAAHSLLFPARSPRSRPNFPSPCPCSAPAPRAHLARTAHSRFNRLARTPLRPRPAERACPIADSPGPLVGSAFPVMTRSSGRDPRPKLPRSRSNSHPRFSLGSRPSAHAQDARACFIWPLPIYRRILAIGRNSRFVAEKLRYHED